MIETSRLALRPFLPGDFDAYHEMRTDPAVRRYLAAKSPTREDTWNRVLRFVGHWTSFGYGIFAVFDKSSGTLVGEIGLADFHRGLGPDFDSDDEGGWVFASAVHGKGVALEAGQAVHGWYDAHRGPRRTVCIIGPENIPSMRLAAKLGYQAYGTASYLQHSVTKFERLAAPRNREPYLAPRHTNA